MHVQTVLTPEEMRMMTTDTGTDDELDQGHETNSYPMITLSVDSETEAESRDPTSVALNP